MLSASLDRSLTGYIEKTMNLLISRHLNIILIGIVTLLPLSAFGVDMEMCKQCHGPEYRGKPEIGAPNLTGLNTVYIKRQMDAYRAGLRGQLAGDKDGQQMAAIAKSLAEKDIEQVSKALDNLTPYLPAQQAIASERGAKIYRSHCTSCHGADALGKKSLTAPALRTLHSEYLFKHLEQYRKGERGRAPADKHGRLMGVMSRTLKREDTKLVVEYILSLPADKVAN